MSFTLHNGILSLCQYNEFKLWTVTDTHMIWPGAFAQQRRHTVKDSFGSVWLLRGSSNTFDAVTVATACCHTIPTAKRKAKVTSSCFREKLRTALLERTTTRCWQLGRAPFTLTSPEPTS